MKLAGTRTKVVEWIQGQDCVVRVEVEGVVPEFDTTEPVLEPETIRFLDEVQEKANLGLMKELEKVGEVYVRRTA